MYLIRILILACIFSFTSSYFAFTEAAEIFLENGSKQRVFIDSLPPNSQVSLRIASNVTRVVTVGRCGQIELSVTPARYPRPEIIKIGTGSELALGALPQNSYQCLNSVWVDKKGDRVEPSTNFINSSGDIVVLGVGDRYPPETRVRVEYIGTHSLRSYRVNSCGFAAIVHSNRRNLSNFFYEGAEYRLSSLPERPGPRCLRVGDRVVRYEPSVR